MDQPFARITGVDPDAAEPPVRAVFEAQARKWGGPLLNHLLYARRVQIFRGVRAMWSGIDASGLIEGKLQALLNRRVASLNGCEFWQDINAAVGSEVGLSNEKILDLANYATSDLYDDRERTALAYADGMTITGLEVSDELFERVRSFFNEDEIVELTMIIAFENSSSKFNRALRVPSQQLWRR